MENKFGKKDFILVGFEESQYQFRLLKLIYSKKTTKILRNFQTFIYPELMSLI